MSISSILAYPGTKGGRATLVGLILTSALVVAASAALANDGDAESILEAMADYVSSQQSIALSFTTPSGAEQVEADALDELDELPPSSQESDL